jgi:hypothetical protein
MATFQFAFSQEETEPEIEKGFRKEKIFIGGGINAGFGSGSLSLGAIPEVGYTVAKWLDAGVVFNLNYNRISADYNYGVKQNSFNYGAGVFARLYPVKFLFLQVQPEYNFTTYKATDTYTGFTQKNTQRAGSLLAGAGYATRVIGRSNFYIAVLFDLMRDINSPYRSGTNTADPVFRTGFNFYLKPSRNK